MEEGYLALSIATTGVNYCRLLEDETIWPDKLISIGYAHGTRSSVKSSGKMGFSLGKPDHLSWKEYYRIQGYDMSRYKEYWRDNLETLELLQKQADIELEPSFARCLHGLLNVMEGSYKSWTILLDSVDHDSVWLDLLLTKHGFPGLNTLRNGGAHPTAVCHTHSYYCGLTRAPIHHSEDRKVEALFSDFTPTPGGCDPQVDAVNILRKYQHVCSKRHVRQ